LTKETSRSLPVVGGLVRSEVHAIPSHATKLLHQDLTTCVLALADTRTASAATHIKRGFAMRKTAV